MSLMQARTSVSGDRSSAFEKVTTLPGVSELFNELSFELDRVTSAYNQLLKLLREPLRGSDPSRHTSQILKQLAALLRFIHERLYCRLRDASIEFVRESGAGGKSGLSRELSSLQGAIRSEVEQRKSAKEQSTPLSDRGSRFTFAVSSLYSQKERDYVSKLVVCGLKKRAFLLSAPSAGLREGDEAEEAFKMGCNVLVSPRVEGTTWAARTVTMESLSDFVHKKCGDECDWGSSQRSEENDYDLDEELNELLNRLEVASPSWTPRFIAETEGISSTEVVPRDMLRGLNGTFSQFGYTDVDSQVTTASCALESSKYPTSVPAKRTYSDSQVDALRESPVDCGAEMFSQVIRYRQETASDFSEEGSSSGDDVERLSPSEWCFQVSCLVNGWKDVINTIRKLGGRVVMGGTYCKDTTHLVITEGATERTEAFLGCCASLKHIVTPRYVYDSQARGRWIVGRFHEYEKNSLLRHWKGPLRPVFAGWRVALFTTQKEVERGILNVLEAGGCTDVKPFRIGHETAAVVDSTTIKGVSHVLVQCFESAKGLSYFSPPPLFPKTLMKMDISIYSLELLHQVLCFARSLVFDESGKLIDGYKLPEWCYVKEAETGVPM